VTNYFNNVFLFSAMMLSTLLLVGCGSDNARLRERAQIEGEESAKKSVEIETRAREDRVQRAEAELQRKLLFYNALEGKYAVTDQNGWELELNVLSTLAYFKTDRVRTEEEVKSDLDRLALKIDMSFSNGAAQESYLADFVKVDLNNGLVTFMAMDHENQPVYEYILSVGGVAEAEDKPNPNGPRIASQILAGSINKIGKVWVKERRLRTRENSNFEMERVK